MALMPWEMWWVKNIENGMWWKRRTHRGRSVGNRALELQLQELPPGSDHGLGPEIGLLHML